VENVLNRTVLVFHDPGLTSSEDFFGHWLRCRFDSPRESKQTTQVLPSDSSGIFGKGILLLAVLSSSWFVAPKGWSALRRLSPDMNLLMSVAVLGYLPRVAFLMDSLMHRYGCNVPAVMATRMLTSTRDRFIAAVISTLVLCSARMTVILGLVAFYLLSFWALLV